MIDPVYQETPPTRLEVALRHERASAAILAIVLPLVCWVWIVVMALDMYGSMSGASKWLRADNWDSGHLLLLWAMWSVMMAGMMLPSATPMLLLYGVVARRSATEASVASRQIYVLAAGYLAAWAIFSLGATMLQRALGWVFAVSSMMGVTNPKVGATLLFIAG